MRLTRWAVAGLQYTALAGFSLLLACAGCEVFLRVYNPFESRVKGYAIELPVNQRYVIKNLDDDKLDRTIIHTTNSLGFRGPEPPADPMSALTVLTIGGSTTECFYLSDGHTWTDRLGRELGQTFHPVWVDNAGLDGQSTFGHLVLLDSIVKMRAKPKVAVFLIGVNDIGHDAPTAEDTTLYRRYSVRRFARRVVEHSELLALGVSAYRAIQARQSGLVQGAAWSTKNLQVDLSRAARRSMTSAERTALVAVNRARYLPAYETRVRELVRRTRANGIEPVLVTQPLLLGPAVDDITGVDLGALRWGKGNGAAMWDVMEMYNDVVRRVGADDSVFVVDLAREMPKSSRYFYDYVHYTNAGAERVGDIIYRRMCPFLSARYPLYRAAACTASPTAGDVGVQLGRSADLRQPRP